MAKRTTATAQEIPGAARTRAGLLAAVMNFPLASVSAPEAPQGSRRWEIRALLGLCVLGGSILAAAPAATQTGEGDPRTLEDLVAADAGSSVFHLEGDKLCMPV